MQETKPNCLDHLDFLSSTVTCVQFKTSFKWTLSLAIWSLVKKKGSKINQLQCLSISDWKLWWWEMTWIDWWFHQHHDFEACHGSHWREQRSAFLEGPGRLDRNFCPACIATACKESDSSSNCRSKSTWMDFWSHPQVKKCWETKQWDECFLFYGLSCGFVNNTNK